MKKIIIAILALASLQVNAQKFMTKTGSINFSASSPIEKIEGNNKSAACLLDSKTGNIDFVVQIKSFIFKQQLMQEHFNENYMESDKFSKATFKGNFNNLTSINFTKDGEYPASVYGKLTIHGVTKDIKSTGTITIKNGKPTLISNFSIKLSDYGIEIPGAVQDKIAKEAKISLNCSLDAMK
jgi:polyisoprenoid-binding protein YceI